MSTFKSSVPLRPIGLIAAVGLGGGHQPLRVVPSSSSHDATSVFGLRLAAASTVVAHAEIVAHLVCHGGSHTHS